MSVEIRLTDGEYKYFSPSLKLETTIGNLVLTYENSVIRTFSERWAHLMHIDYSSGPQALPHGLRVAKETMDWLFEQEFPYRFDPIPDKATMDWFIGVSMMELCQEMTDDE